MIRPLLSRAFALFALVVATASSALAQNYSFSTFAGTPGAHASIDDTGTAARLNRPSGLAIDGNGVLYIADRINRTIRRITPAGVVTTIAGTAGVQGDADGNGAAAQFRLPTAIAVDSSGNLYVSDQGSHTIRKIAADGTVTTLAGSPQIAGAVDATGSEARFRTPSAIAVDASGNVFVGDSGNHVIRKITPAGVVTTFAGVTGTRGSIDATGTAAQFNYPAGLAFDPAGNLYVSDGSNNLIRKITAAGVVTTIAGTALAAGSVDGTGSAARFSFPAGIAVDPTGALIVSDESNSTLRKITAAGVVTTIGGSPGVLGSTDGIGAAASFRFANGVVTDRFGNLYIADEGNSTIRLGLVEQPRLISLSQRASSTGGDGALLASFSIEGTADKLVLIRAAGPLLAGAPFNISGAMADPFLAVYGSNGVQLFNNNDWSNNTMMTDAFATVGAVPFAAGSKDSAVLAMLQPGNYTVRVTGVGATTGVALLELYDLQQGQRIAYASNRATVSASAVNTTTFALGGTGTGGLKQVLIRAVGTGLGVPSALANPTITVKAAGGTVLGTNDDFGTHPHQTQLSVATAAAGAMPLAPTDSALLLTLPVGIYTIETSGVGGASGVALTEVHLIDAERPGAFSPRLLVPLHDQSLVAGGTITYSAPFLSKPAPQIQWQKNGVDLPGQTGLSLTLNNLALADAGAYRVVMTNASGTLTSGPSQLKAAQTITFPEIAPRQYIFDSTFTLNATASSGLAVVYASSNPEVATITGNTVTIKDVGTTTISAVQGGDSTFAPATLVQRTFIVTKRTITVTLGSLSQTYDGTGKTATAILDPDVPATVVFTYDGGSTPPVNAGSYNVAATLNSIHYEGTTSGSLVINKAAQSIGFLPIDDVGIGSTTSFTVNAAATSGLPITLVSSDPAVATVNANTVTLTGGGTVTITAQQGGNANYFAAPSVGRTFTVTKASATVTLGNLVHTYSGSAKAATATTSPEGLTLTFAYTASGDPIAAPINAGVYGVTATVVSNTHAGSASGVLTINKATQTISFSELGSHGVDEGTLVIASAIASASSGLPLTFTSATPAVASVSGNTVTLHTTGATQITAFQNGNENYLAADHIARTLVVTAASQTITFPAIPAKTFGNAPFALEATSNRGLTVSYVSSNTGVATISGNTVIIVGAGTSTITASQAGNASYGAAPDVTRTLTVAKATATVTLGGLAATYDGNAKPATVTTSPAGLALTFTYTPGGATAPTNAGSYQVAAAVADPNYTGNGNGTLVIAKAPQTIAFATLAPRAIGSGPLTLAATSDSGLAVTYTSSAAAVATVSGSTATLVGVGDTTITAQQAGNTNYLAAANVARTLTVTPAAPVIVSAPPATVSTIRGQPFSYGPIALNVLSAPVTFSATGLPAGLSVSASTGTISGTPTADGTSTITLTASNVPSNAPATHVVTLTVQPPPPVITSAASATGVAGTAFSYTIAASNSPTSFAATNLPAWLSVNTTTGALTGTPPSAASVTIQITATNATGSVTVPLTIAISSPANAPVYSGTLSPSGTAGTALTFTPNFGGTASTTFALTGTLPTGVSFSSSTGALTGTPTQTGTFPLAIAATRSGVTATAELTLTINPATTAPVVGFPTGGNVRAATVGAAFGPLALTATPAATSFAATGLPAGITINSTTGAIGGTPTVAGTATVSITASNAAGAGPVATLIIAVAPNAGAPRATSPAIVRGQVGESFSYTLTATPGATGWSTSGTLPLPPGLVFDSVAGTITGAPQAAMTRQRFFAGTNASGTGIALEVTFIIEPSSLVPGVNSNGTASGQVGISFSYTISATGTPTSFSTTMLPPGLTLDAVNGLITGIPSAATPPDSPTLVRLGATNSFGTSLPRNLLISIAPAAATPVITSAATATARVGTAFTYQISATGSPSSFVATGLPAGLSLAPTTGTITGTPTTAGPVTALISASNASGLGAPAELSFTIAAAALAPSITSGPSASGQVGVAFTYQTVATPGPIVSYALTGMLPTGLTFNTSTGLLSGTPTAAGTATVTLAATNADGTSLPQSLDILIRPAAGVPVITSASVASATAGSAFTYTITATNAPHTALDAVNLPEGLAVNPFTGVIQGTPVAVGTTVASLVGSNAAGTGPIRDLVIEVRPAGLAPAITSPAAASVQVGATFAYQITATNGPTGFEVFHAPPWMTINAATGALGGTPAAPGLVSITLVARNSVGSSAPVNVAVNVAALAGTPVVTSGRTASGTVGVAFAGYTATAAPAATSFTAVGLPPGLTINATSGAITGTPTASGTFLITLAASNATGAGTPVTLTLTILPNATLVVPGS